MVMCPRSIEGYPGYTVDCYGGVHGPSGRMLRPQTNSRGYSQVSLCGNYRPRAKSHAVHTLVARHFLDVSGAEVNHKDCAKSSNAWHNLEWVSSSANKLHATAHGLYPVQGNHYKYVDGSSDRGRIARRQATLNQYS